MVHQRVEGPVRSESAPAIYNWNEVYSAAAAPSALPGDTGREVLQGRDDDEYYAVLRMRDNTDEYD